MKTPPYLLPFCVSATLVPVSYSSASSQRFNRRQQNTGTITIEQKGQFKSPVREFLFSVCSENSDQQAADVIDPLIECKPIRLWILPGENQGMSRSVQMIKTKGMLHSDGILTPGAGDQCGSTASNIDIAVLGAYTLSDDINQNLYIIYDAPLSFVLTTASSLQILLLAKVGEDASRNTKTLTKLNQNSALADNYITGTDIWIGMHDFEIDCTFSAYGLLPVATYFEVGAVDLRTGGTLSSSTSANSYTWVRPASEKSVRWVLHDEVTDDTECPKKRFLATTKHNYLTASAIPGEGWSYSDTSKALSVGIPFPIETVVKGISEERSWQFKPSQVVARVRSWSGCSSGESVTSYRLLSSTLTTGLAVLNGDLSSFTQQNAVTEGGAAILWLAFQEPCQRCSLELMLCYSGAKGTSDCMSSNVHDDNSYRPVFAERIKITKPMTVRNPIPDTIQVTSHTFPPTGEFNNGIATLQVGAKMTISYQSVVTYGRKNWSFTYKPSQSDTSRYKTTIWIYSLRSSGELLYSNGGHISNLEAESCNVPEESFISASKWGVAKSGLSGSSSSITFHFTRPCRRCEVTAYFQITDTVENKIIRDGSFPLRVYTRSSNWGMGHLEAVWTPSNILKFIVTTCATRWVKAGPQLRVAIKNKSFSISTWKSDANGIPTGNVSNSEIAANIQLRSGTGTGGHLMVEQVSLEGSVTIKAKFSRSCQHCVISIGAQSTSLSVLAPPDQINVIPSDDWNMFKNKFINNNMFYNVSLVMYASDSDGERSYLVNGPSDKIIHTMPSYIKKLPSEEKVTTLSAVITSTLKPFETTLRFGGRSGIENRKIKVETGSAIVSVFNGSTLVDGTPISEQSSPGVVILGIKTTPLYFAKLILETAPTYLYGIEGLPPIISITQPPQFLTFHEIIGSSLDVHVDDIISISLFTISTYLDSYYASDYTSEVPITMESDCEYVVIIISYTCLLCILI